MKFESQIKIGNKTIGTSFPVFIIAEVGVNHNGSLEIAKKMIRSAKDCGVDAVKFQTFTTEEFMSDRKKIYSYLSQGKVVKEPMYDMFKRLELPFDWHEILFRYARENGLIPLSSAADAEAVRLLKKLNIGAIKLASEDLTNALLIKEACKTGLPVILSTGMATEQEISKAIMLIIREKNKNLILLHCTSLYPTPPEEANILRIETLRRKFDCLVGFSDHTEGKMASIGAAALRAVVIEKHFTLDKNMPGPDHQFSADPEELRDLVVSVRMMEKLRGNGNIHPSGQELKSLTWCRRSIVAVRDIAKGEIISGEKICFKRPGTGISPQDVKKVLGKKTNKLIKINQQVLLKDLKG